MKTHSLRPKMNYLSNNILLCLIICLLLPITNASSVCPSSTNSTNTTQLCSSPLICFYVVSVNSLTQFEIQFSNSPQFFWTNPQTVTSIAINEQFLASSLYNFTQINSTFAQVDLNVSGYIPPDATVAVQITDSSNTPILAYNTACGPLLITQSSTSNSSGLAEFINISSALHFFLLLIFSIGDYGWGGMLRRSLMLDFMLHLRFVNVNMTTDLKNFYSIASKSYISAALPVSITDSANTTMVGKFAELSYPPQFFSNFCGEFFLLLIIIVIGSLIALLSSIKWEEKNGNFPRFIRYLNKSINYNLIVNMMVGYSLRAFVAIFVNLSKPVFGSPLNTLSFLLAIVFLLVYLIMSALIIRTLWQRSTSTKRSDRQHYNRATIVYHDYSLQSSLQLYFMPLAILRAFLAAIILVVIQSNPTAQLVLLLLLHTVYLTFTSALNPLKHSLDHLVQTVGELMLAFVIISMFGLGSQTAYGSSSSDNTIAWGCIIFTFFYSLFLFFVAIYELVTNFRYLFHCTPYQEETVKKLVKVPEVTYDVMEIKLNFESLDKRSKRKRLQIDSEPDETTIQDFINQITIRGDTSRRSVSEMLSQFDKDRARREQQLRELWQLNEAKLVLREALEEEMENRSVDEQLDEVQEIKEAREREREKAFSLAAPNKTSETEANKFAMALVRIKPFVDGRAELTQKQIEEGNKLTDKALKKANTQVHKQDQPANRRETQMSDASRPLLRASSLILLGDSMRISQEGLENNPSQNFVNNSADASFIENFLKEIPSDDAQRRSRDRRLSGQSDALGVELISEMNRMRVKNEKVQHSDEQKAKGYESGLPSSKRMKVQTHSDLLELIRRKHSKGLEQKIPEEVEYETPKNLHQNQNPAPNKADKNDIFNRLWDDN